MRLPLLALFLCAIQASPVYAASWFGPDNYEDCILENIPKATTRSAERLVVKTCRDKFPGTAKTSHVNVLGRYVCRYDSEVNVIIINEKTKTIIHEKTQTSRLKGKKQTRIAQITREALYSEAWKSGSYTMQWVFYRLGENPTATHDTISAELMYERDFSDRTKRFSCEKTI